MNQNILDGLTQIEELTINTIDIFLQKTKGKKHITIIEGLDKMLSEEQITDIFKKLKKQYGCGGTLILNSKKNLSEKGYITFQGDHVNQMKQFLINYGDKKTFTVNNIKIHGC